MIRIVVVTYRLIRLQRSPHWRTFWDRPIGIYADYNFDPDARHMQPRYQRPAHGPAFGESDRYA